METFLLSNIKESKHLRTFLSKIIGFIIIEFELQKIFKDSSDAIIIEMTMLLENKLKDYF